MNSEVPSFQRIVVLVTEESKAEMSARVAFAGIYTWFFPVKATAQDPAARGLPQRLGAEPGTRRGRRPAVYVLLKVFGKLSLTRRASASSRD